MILKYPGSKANYLPVLSPSLNGLVDGEIVFVYVSVGAGSILLHVTENHPHLPLVGNDLEPLAADFWQVLPDPDQTDAPCDRLQWQLALGRGRCRGADPRTEDEKNSGRSDGLRE